MHLPLDVLEHIADKLASNAIRPLEDILEPKCEFWGHRQHGYKQPTVYYTALGHSFTPRPSKQGLKAFCLVSRECRRAALKHLYHTIELTTVTKLHALLDVLCGSSKDDDGDATPISSTLLPRPHIFVRRLTVNFPIAQCLYKSSLGSYSPEPLSDDRLPKLLDLLAGSDCNLEGLRLTALKVLPVEWPHLTASLRMSIRNLIQQPTMRVLSFVSIKNLPTYIFRGLEITALQLKYTRSYDELHRKHGYMHLRAEDDAEVQDAERLERLQLLPKLEYFRSNHDFGNVMMPDENAGSMSSWEPGTVKHLKRCTITVRGYYRDNARILDFAAGSQMKVLKVITRETHTFGGFQPPLAPDDDFNFGRFPHLEKVVLVRNLNVNSVDGLAPEASMLSEGDPCPNLHTLSFRVLYWGFRNNLCRNYLIDHANSRKSWSRLVKALVSGKYPALRCVRFDITARLKMRTYDTTQEENRMRVAIEGYFESFLVSRSSGVQLELNICVRRLKQALGQSPDGSEWEESDGYSYMV